MNYEQNKEYGELRDLIRTFAQKEITPTAAQRDEEERFDRTIFDQMGELGIAGIPYSDEFGGAGMYHLANVIAIEEISKADPSVGSDLSIHSALASWVISEFATDQQKQRYLAPLAAGRKFGAFSLTEPNAGSDYGSMRTTAIRDGDAYVFNGSKIFTSNGGVADLYVVFALTEPSAQANGISAFIVEKDLAGFSTCKPERKLGIRAHQVTELSFDNCRVPAANRLGAEGQGYAVAKRALQSGRLGMSAQALGIAKAAYEHARGYVQTRTQFAKPIADLQSIQFKLAEMLIKIEAAEQLVYRAAWRQSCGLPFGFESSVAKAFTSTIAMEITTEAVQIFGGYGFIRDYPVERLLRDAKITQIYTGTVEMQKVAIAEQILSENR